MKSFINFSVAAALIVVNVLFAQPKISVDKTEIDAGIIYNGDMYHAQWMVKNTGNQTLTILDVHTSCGCTSARIPKSSLAPGEWDTLMVNFNSTNFHGPIHKFIEISSNDPNSPTTTLKLTGNVQSELEPVDGNQTVWLGNVSLGKEIKQSIKFKNNSSAPISLYEFSSSDKSVHLNSGALTVNPSDTIDVPVSIIPNKEGYASESIQLQTTSKKQSTITITVSYNGIYKLQ